MDEALPPSSSKPIEGYLERIDALLRKIIRSGEFQLTFSIRKNDGAKEGSEDPDYVVEFTGGDTDLLLEKNGTVLDALEHVILKAVRLDEEHFGKIAFDCKDWRRLRTEELRLTAQIAAERVIESGDPFILNPMNARERRIVHLALRDFPSVRTASEGAGAERKVVIHPTTPPRRKR